MIKVSESYTFKKILKIKSTGIRTRTLYLQIAEQLFQNLKSKMNEMKNEDDIKNLYENLSAKSAFS